MDIGKFGQRDNIMVNKSGYIDIDENEEVVIEELKLSNSVSILEQEVSINFMRDENFATIYTSDTTYMTKLDKLCKTSPDMYSLIADTGRGKTYRVEDKTLISFRAKKREISEEQRIAAGERMRKYQESKKLQNTVYLKFSNVQSRKFYVTICY